MLERKGRRLGSRVFYEPDNLLRITNMGSSHKSQKGNPKDAVSVPMGWLIWHLTGLLPREGPSLQTLNTVPSCKGWAIHSETHFLTRLPCCNERRYFSISEVEKWVLPSSRTRSMNLRDFMEKPQEYVHWTTCIGSYVHFLDGITQLSPDTYRGQKPRTTDLEQELANFLQRPK